MGTLLQSGDSFPLSGPSGEPLARLSINMGWDVVARDGGFLDHLLKKEIDLDLSCLLLNEAKELVDVVWFHQVKSLDGSVTHSGDNTTGDGDGDDERILVDLLRLPAMVKTLAIVVNSFEGHAFERVRNSYCRWVDPASGEELARYPLEHVQGDHDAMIVAKLVRQPKGWLGHALGLPAKGKTFLDLMPDLARWI